jgi:flagellar hook-basal body complex protein FliE
MVDNILFNPLRPIQPPEQTGGASLTGKVTGPSFQEVLADTLNRVDTLQARAADAMRESFNPADPKAIHEVMLAVEEANIAFQFTMEVRNRLMEAYNEVMRMQV